MSEYEAVIGLETHAQIRTRSKQFCRCAAVNTREIAEANQHICPVCLGHPGVLPVLNRESVLQALALGVRVGSEIARRSIFARKNYFYPDLPKGYQITQYQTPLLAGGRLEYFFDGEVRIAELERAHLEEDTAKIFYLPSGEVFLDYNRAGIPLLEIVTRPMFHSPAEAVAFLEELRLVLRQLGISHASMEEGNFRCEPNVSVRPRGSDELRTKTEIKNLNSYATLMKALSYEIERQQVVWESGSEVAAQTLRWDEAAARTVPMRVKETQADYRYFDEPDLPPLVVEEAELAEARRRTEAAGHVIQWAGEEKRFPSGTAHLTAFLCLQGGLREEDARLLSAEPDSLALFAETVGLTGKVREAANWVLQEYRPRVRGERGKITARQLGDLINARAAGEIGSSQAKEVFALVFGSGKSVTEAIAELGFDTKVAEQELVQVCADVIAANPKVVADIRRGKHAAVRALVGGVMKQTHGNADPRAAEAELKRQLEL
ncbi:MAG: glutaminyl-tRNA synthase (glutamine-hydrolyzing) subunit B [Planctomycetales bacterium 4484_113]|nr:MAG: glutaminyl-tRNA synthase (glutamine-hydrolyzing) subunit B [Planctomycetales bacterium 4484_113]